MTGGAIRSLGYSGFAAERDADAVARAIQEATSVAEACGRAMGRELGEIVDIEELPEPAEVRAKFPLLRVTFTLSPGTATSQGGGEDAGDVLLSVPLDFRDVYSEFRSRLLSEHEGLRPRPSPVGKRGLHRYEGFVFRDKAVIYARFRKRGVNLIFQLPRNDDVPRSEYVTSGSRDWRQLLLDRPQQLDGALLLAQDTIESLSGDRGADAGEVDG